MVTIEDVWRHVSNKIANKVNDPWDELFAMIIPIDDDGNFLEPISSMCAEYDGDSYKMINGLANNTDRLPTAQFAYVCPAKSNTVKPEDFDEYLARRNSGEKLFVDEQGNDTREKILLVVLVHGMVADEDDNLSDAIMESGVYWIGKNHFEVGNRYVNGMPEGSDDPKDFNREPLTVALGALALRWAIDHDRLGELGRVLRESLRVRNEAAKQAVDALRAAIDKL